MARLSPLPLCVLTCLMQMLFIFNSSSSAAAGCDEKVKLDVYYETYCVPSANFMVNNLSKIFTNELSNITDLHFIPFGNAKFYNYHNTLICQNGDFECQLNIIQACAIDLWPNVNVHYPVLRCLESLVVDHNYFHWKSCFRRMGLNAKLIDKCYRTGKGYQLEIRHGKATDSLKPPHEFVPWVVVNGEPLKERYVEFMSFICKAYKGDSRPEACKCFKPPQAKESDIKEVCDRGEMPLSEPEAGASRTTYLMPSTILAPLLSCALSFYLK